MNGLFEDVAKKISQANEDFRNGDMQDDSWELMSLTSAMYSTPGSMEGKLRAIWQVAEDLVRETEKFHEGVLVKSWKSQASKILTAKTLEQKAAAIPRDKISDNIPSLTDRYCAVVKAAGDIGRKYWELRRSRHHLDFDLEAIDLIARENFLYSRRAMDSLIVLFFPLQLRCYELRQMLYAAPGTMAGAAARSRKASAGGGAAKHGEELLLKKYVEFFNGKEVKKRYSSIEALAQDMMESIARILEDFQRNDVGAELDGRKISYGKNIKYDNIHRTMLRWRKESPIFSKSIGRHLNSHKDI